MATSSIFPAFIKAEFDPSGGGFAEFERAAKTAGERAGAQTARAYGSRFKVDLSELQTAVQRAMTMPEGVTGGTLKIRQAAVAAEQQAAVYREVARRAVEAASAEGTLSAETARYVATARAAADAADRQALELGQNAVALERLQLELISVQRASGAAVGGSRALAVAQSAGIQSANAQRFAYVQLGQQLTDVAIQAQMGVNPFMILVQQGSQAAFAMTGFSGAVGRVASFLAGPWGAAVFAATAVLGGLVGGLRDTEDAADNAKKATDTFREGLLDIGKFADETTGKLLKLADASIRAAIAMRETKRVEKDQRIVDLRDQAFGIAEGTRGSRFVAERQPFAQTFDLDVEKAIAASGNSIVQLERNLAKLNRPDLKPIIDEISKLAGEALDAKKFIDDLNEGIRFLRGERDTVPGFKPKRTRKPRDLSGQRAALEEFGEDAGKKLADITGRFSDAPKLAEKVAKALREIDDLADDIARRKPSGFTKLLSDAEQAKVTVRDSLNRPFQELLKSQVEAFDIQELINDGKYEEAEATRLILSLERQMGPIGEQREALIRATTVALSEQARQADINRQKQQMYLRTLDDVRGNIEQTIANLGTRGLKSVGDFTSGLRQSFNQLNASFLTDRLFGGVFRDMEEWITGRDKVRKANEGFAISMIDAREVVLQFNAAMEEAANARRRAEDPDAQVQTTQQDLLAEFLKNKGDIVVTAQEMRNPRIFIEQLATKLITATSPQMAPEEVEKLGKRIGGTVADVFTGAGYGAMAGGLILGNKGSSTGSAIGGALGNMAGKAIGKAMGPALGKLASFAGPLGSVLGGLAGGLIGGMFSKTKKGVSTIGVNADGQLIIASQTGNSKKFRQASGGAADSAIATIERVAEMLGGDITGRGSVSIGVRDGKFRVDPSGRGATKLKHGAIDFGDDSAAAVRAATLDLIKDGMIGGLRASTQRLLQNAKDLDAGIEKALKFESVFTRLKEFTNPVGAALDALDKEFKSLRNTFKEAGASAEEFADLEKLYGLEREKAIKEAGSAMTSALKGLLDDLTVNNEALSLRDRLATAREAFDPLAADLKAGKNIDFDAFAEAGRNVEQLVRQIEGSGSGYFAFRDELVAMTTRALADQQALIDGATASPSPLGPDTSASAPVVTAVDRLGEKLGGIMLNAIGGRLDAVNANIGRLITVSGGGGGGRSFAGFQNRLNF